MKRTVMWAAVLLAVPLLAARAGGAQMKVTSNAFGSEEKIPQKYSCQGEDASPELKIEGVPEGAKSLALIVDDPDAPMGTFVHWVMFNIPPATTQIPENGAAGDQGLNSMRQNRWTSPCPPTGTHRYYFKVYALDTRLSLAPEKTDKQALEAAMKGHILGQAELMGTYSKK